MRRPAGRRLVLAIALGWVVAACGQGGSPGVSPSQSAPVDATLRVVASITVLEDIVRSIGGDHVIVDSIVPSGAGPEDYEPRPDDARRLADAELIVSNGVGLDGFLDDLIDAAGAADADRLVVGEGIATIEADGETNPHFWLDPTLVERYYVPAIRDAIVRLLPEAADDIRQQADAYAAQLRELDEANRMKLAAIRPERRKLVTFHDAFPYFARHYGFELIGVILENPGQEPAAADLAALVRTIRASGVRAVFTETQFDPKLARTLADEAGVTVVSTLSTDTLGPAPADTYLGLMTWDVEEIVKALS
jgi:zinc/manganese transport system substrate-binding protein/manganese/iron transport system substrate-binding protein